MRFLTPFRMILLGGFLLVLGVVFPLLMVIKVIESTFALNFISYTLSLVGTVIGIIGTAFYAGGKRRDRF